MVNSDYSIYQKSTAWIARFSFRARGNTMTKDQQQDQASVLSAPGVLSSPESSGFTSVGPMDSDAFSSLISPSPSTSTSSWTSILSTTKKDDDLMDDEQEEYKQHPPNPSLPPSPTLTACDHRTLEPPTLLPLDATSYFANRPLPTQRRQPGRNRHSAIESGLARPSSTSLHDGTEPERPSLEKLAYDTLTYFVDAPSPSASSPLLQPTAASQQPSSRSSELVERLTSRLTASSSVHPSVLKLAQDVLAFMNETPPLAPECQRLKPKLEVCVLIHGHE